MNRKFNLNNQKLIIESNALMQQQDDLDELFWDAQVWHGMIARFVP